ncbi:MAG: COX15/CtaA family protein [Anaerolineae bacterium]|nr:COX15/CtaA family protein [Anaerolineae bacterium]
MTIDQNYRRLTLVTAALIYTLIVVGAVVRVTESGLGCPDWPLCHGGLVPPPEQTAVIEFAHRLVAGVAGLFIILTAFVAWRDYRRARWIVGPATLVIALVPVQYVLGAVVVATELQPLAVVIHLGTALFIFGGALVLAVAARRPAAPERWPSRAATWLCSASRLSGCSSC